MKWFERATERAKRTGRPLPETVGEALLDHLDERKLATVKPKARPWLIDPPPPETERKALARLADGAAQRWTCSIRDTLLASGYIEITYLEDGRWAGDRITEAGKRRLASR